MLPSSMWNLSLERRLNCSMSCFCVMALPCTDSLPSGYAQAKSRESDIVLVAGSSSFLSIPPKQCTEYISACHRLHLWHQEEARKSWQQHQSTEHVPDEHKRQQPTHISLQLHARNAAGKHVHTRRNTSQNHHLTDDQQRSL